NTFVLRPEVFDENNLGADDLSLVPVRCELWGGCAWINLDDSAPPLRECIEPFASRHDEWKVGALRTEWWKSCLHFMRTLGSGMGGMTHENDVRIAEGLQNMSLPDDPAAAMASWRSAVNDAVTNWHRARGCDFPDLN